MAGVVPITIVGNLAADPEFRMGASGKGQVRFRVIATRRRLNRDTQQWEDAGQLSPWCVAWEGLAENISETLTKGMRVIVSGQLEERRYEDKQGQTRYALELTVDDIGPSLKYATAKVTKSQRNAGGFGGGGFSGGGSYNGGGYQGNSGYNQPQTGSYNAAPGRAPQAQPDNPWDSADSGFDTGFGDNGFADAPPF